MLLNELISVTLSEPLECNDQGEREVVPQSSFGRDYLARPQNDGVWESKIDILLFKLKRL